MRKGAAAAMEGVVSRVADLAVEESGNVPTFQEIFSDNVDFVLRTVQRLGVRPADVEDVAQQVFVVVHRKLSRFDGRCKVRTWLFAIARRTVADYRKRSHRRHEVTISRPPDPPDRPTQADRLELDQAREILEAALEELDDEKRSVFILYELEELPMAEIAEAIGVPLQTAYSRLYAARERVRAYVLAAFDRRRAS